ncbi:trehalose-6-phosphate synthase [Brevibacterium sp. 2SA]|uniref:alpha,alpha-trehalose-phosphate synthase (UDP-forming) n=1 Tax=Brevibacterium sp. 2SA TaxID=2502198 RepID=UPI0010FA40FA|nr:trehalose-6-phosphate synthase [Brevibacterium sp. 2SA]
MNTHPYVVVANRLPCERAADAWRASPGGVVTALTPVTEHSLGAWVGWAGGETAEEPRTHHGMPLIPVALGSAEIDAYYEGFANATLWPLYHANVSTPQFRRSWWEAYVAVNRRFAEVTAEVCAPGATVWIHDYHLQLVPRLLRELRPDVRIGFFSHIPFPSVDLFAQLPWRTEILRGILGADVIGFQRRRDVRNFEAACAALLGPGSTASATVVDAYPVSVDVGHIRDIAGSGQAQAEATRIRADLGEPATLLLGIDRLDHTKGILERLLALEELFDNGTLDPRTTRMVQVAVPSRERIPAYRQLREDIERTVGRINGKFAGLAGTTIHYLHRDYAFESVIAWYIAADVLLATSMRDGMNLVAKEYVTARAGRGGALVLSEFAGAADELTDALIVNPHDREAMVQAIAEAVAMDPAAARARIDAMAEVVADHDVYAWANRFTGDLAEVAAEDPADAAAASTPTPSAASPAPAAAPAQWMI